MTSTSTPSPQVQKNGPSSLLKSYLTLTTKTPIQTLLSKVSKQSSSSSSSSTFSNVPFDHQTQINDTLLEIQSNCNLIISNYQALGLTAQLSSEYLANNKHFGIGGDEGVPFVLFSLSCYEVYVIRSTIARVSPVDFVASLLSPCRDGSRALFDLFSLRSSAANTTTCIDGGKEGGIEEGDGVSDEQATPHFTIIQSCTYSILQTYIIELLDEYIEVNSSSFTSIDASIDSIKSTFLEYILSLKTRLFTAHTSSSSYPTGSTKSTPPPPPTQSPSNVNTKHLLSNIELLTALTKHLTSTTIPSAVASLKSTKNTLNSITDNINTNRRLLDHSKLNERLKRVNMEYLDNCEVGYDPNLGVDGGFADANGGGGGYTESKSTKSISTPSITTPSSSPATSTHADKLTHLNKLLNTPTSTNVLGVSTDGVLPSAIILKRYTGLMLDVWFDLFNSLPDITCDGDSVGVSVSGSEKHDAAVYFATLILTPLISRCSSSSTSNNVSESEPESTKINKTNKPRLMQINETLGILVISLDSIVKVLTTPVFLGIVQGGGGGWFELICIGLSVYENLHLPLGLPTTTTTTNDNNNNNNNNTARTTFTDTSQSYNTQTSTNHVRDTKIGLGDVNSTLIVPFEQMIRRRCVRVIGVWGGLIDFELEGEVERASSSASAASSSDSTDDVDKSVLLTSNVATLCEWTLYTQLFELAELEFVEHLVDQMFGYIRRLSCKAYSTSTCTSNSNLNTNSTIPAPAPSSASATTPTMRNIEALLTRTLHSENPQIKKLTLYRLFTGCAGFGVCEGLKVFLHDNDKDKGKDKKHQHKQAVLPQPLPPSSVLSPGMISTIITSLNSLKSHGTTFQFTIPGGKVPVNVNLEEMCLLFVGEWVSFNVNVNSADAGGGGGEEVTRLIKMVFNGIQYLQAKIITLVFNCLTSFITLTPNNESKNNKKNMINIDKYTVLNMIYNMKPIITADHVSLSSSILLGMSKLLSSLNITITTPSTPNTTISSSKSKSDIRSNNKGKGFNPNDVLYILSAFTLKTHKSAKHTLSINEHLTSFLKNIPNNFIDLAPGAVCMMYVNSASTSNGSGNGGDEDVLLPWRERGGVIGFLCLLSAGYGGGSQALWPSISKTLPTPPSPKHPLSLTLLITGTFYGLLGGSGNGVILQSEKRGTMIAPPPAIDHIVVCAFKLLIGEVKGVGFKTDVESLKGTKQAMESLDSVLRVSKEMCVVKGGFVNSSVLEGVVREFFYEGLTRLYDYSNNNSDGEGGGRGGGDGLEKTITLAWLRCILPCIDLADDTLSLSLTGGKKTSVKEIFDSILKMEFKTDPTTNDEDEDDRESVNVRMKSSSEEQAARSAFQYCKWGVLEVVCNSVFRDGDSEDNDGEEGGKERITVDYAIEVAMLVLNQVQTCPIPALVSLFTVGLASANYVTSRISSSPTNDPYVSAVSNIVQGLWNAVNEHPKAYIRNAMTAKFAAVVFTPALLASPKLNTPNSTIRIILTEMLAANATGKGFIGRVAVMYLCGGLCQGLGECGVAYRDVLVELVLHKEVKACGFKSVGFEEEVGEDGESVSVEGGKSGSGRKSIPPQPTPETSLTRAASLMFLEWLPAASTMPPQLLKDLPHYLILKLLKLNMTSSMTKIQMIGTADYCRKLRSWQCLALLVRFVTADIIEEVASLFFQITAINTLGNIRYYIECFGIKLLTLSPSSFASHLTNAFLNHSLPAQAQATLLTIAGYGLLGKDKDEIRKWLSLKEVLYAIVPYLGSTQGFCRASAQLLGYELIPEYLASVVDKYVSGFLVNDVSFLQRIHAWLKHNPEMTRLRQKQSKFFYTLDSFSDTTVRGLLSVSHDDQEDPIPETLIDGVKGSMQEIFEEGHEGFNRVIDFRIGNDGGGGDDGSDGVINFQRKILPLDVLNLIEKQVLHDRTLNAAGVKKQELIICASLIDKPPNLAGLARTAEIFAVESLVVPDIKVKKLDLFKSISVAAGEWVDIIEVSELNLKSYLLLKKFQGYTIVALEQTQSSQSLSTFPFPSSKVLLLLGDEKRGVPVELLEVVDFCVEVPQFGVTRSLNVHVTGALAVWEFTRQRKMGQGGGGGGGGMNIEERPVNS